MTTVGEGAFVSNGEIDKDEGGTNIDMNVVLCIIIALIVVIIALSDAVYYLKHR